MKSLEEIVSANHFERREQIGYGLPAIMDFAYGLVYRLKFILALPKLEFIMDSLFRAFSIYAPSPST